MVNIGDRVEVDCFKRGVGVSHHYKLRGKVVSKSETRELKPEELERSIDGFCLEEDGTGEEMLVRYNWIEGYEILK